MVTCSNGSLYDLLICFSLSPLSCRILGSRDQSPRDSICSTRTGLSKELGLGQCLIKSMEGMKGQLEKEWGLGTGKLEPLTHVIQGHGPKAQDVL